MKITCVVGSQMYVYDGVEDVKDLGARFGHVIKGSVRGKSDKLPSNIRNALRLALKFTTVTAKLVRRVATVLHDLGCRKRLKTIHFQVIKQ